MGIDRNLDLVERLALAVVKPGGNALLVNEDNSTVDYWVPVDKAAQSGMPFPVELKDDLAAFDLDSDELVSCGEALEEWALSEELPVVVVTSGREGHRHLYVRSEDRAIVESHALEFGIPATARRRSIRPPLAPHRLGLQTALVRPESVEEVLDALRPPVIDEPATKELPEWLLKVISEGDTQGRYATHSAMALGIASTLRGAGYDFHTYRTVMASRDNAGGAKYHALEDGEGREKPDAFLARTWEKAANSLSPAEIVAELERARAAVMAAEWKGRTGNSDRAVMLALCQLGINSGTTQFAFGSRGIALAAQIEDKTARKALGRLVAAGWLEKFTADQTGHSDTYRLGHMATMTAYIPSPHRGKCGSYDQIDPDRVSLHPAFRNGSGLGQGPGRTWLILRRLSRPATAKEVGEASAAKSRTVGRHLKLLESHGLAVKEGRFWTAAGDVQRLDELAISFGAVERSEIQAERYERNRLAFRYIKGLPIGDEVGLSDEEAATEEDEYRHWYQEQLLLE